MLQRTVSFKRPTPSNYEARWYLTETTSHLQKKNSFLRNGRRRCPSWSISSDHQSSGISADRPHKGQIAVLLIDRRPSAAIGVDVDAEKGRRLESSYPSGYFFLPPAGVGPDARNQRPSSRSRASASKRSSDSLSLSDVTPIGSGSNDHEIRWRPKSEQRTGDGIRVPLLCLRWRPCLCNPVCV